MKNIYDDIKSTKHNLRKEYKFIRNSNSPLIYSKIELNVKSALNILLNKYHVKEKFIGIYWPLKGEVDIRFIKEINNLKVALPSSSKSKALTYHHWSNNKLQIDSNSIPTPTGKNAINPNDISCLLYTSPSPRDATLSRMPSSA